MQNTRTLVVCPKCKKPLTYKGSRFRCTNPDCEVLIVPISEVHIVEVAVKEE